MYLIENDLLIREWDYKKNTEIGLSPDSLVVGSNKYAFWICSECGNEWRAQIAKRGIRGQGCPICGKAKSKQNRVEKQIAEQGSLLDLFPEIANEWDSEKNQRKPNEVLSGSNAKAFWKCGQCGYRWTAQICKRTVRGQGCPICAKEKLAKAQKRNLMEQIHKYGSLGSEYPELVKEWDHEKNENSPYDFLSGSNKSAFWICSKCGYKWNARIANRVKGVGCPKCAKEIQKKNLLENLIAEKGSLKDNAPEIAAEWDYKKNDTLLPENVMLNTNKSVWWVCKECGYSWKTSVANRAMGRGCPKCALIQRGISSSTPIEGVNDLLSQAPKLAMELHPIKNGDISAKDLARSSNKKVWWLGKCGHEWQATVGSRYEGRGCPCCLKEFKISYPEKAIFYYLRKYLNCTVEENYKADWLCGKELDIYIPSIKLGIEYDGSNWHKDTKSDESKNKICKDNHVELLRIREIGTPDIEYDNIYYINASSDKDSELVAAVSYIFTYIESRYGLCINYSVDISNDRSDIYELMELNRKENSLAILYPEISAEWHTKKNGTITPEYVNAHTHRKYWWVCPQGHEYEMVVKHRVEKRTCCPICSNHRVLAGYNDLAYKRPDVARKWDYERNGKLKPTDVMEFSNIKVWWKCEKGHSYQRMVSHQSIRDSGCPVCKMQVLQVGVNDLFTLFPTVAAEWDNEANNGELPNMYTPISHKRFNWKCGTCGWRWNISINSRCILGHGCPKCARSRKSNMVKKIQPREYKLKDPQ